MSGTLSKPDSKAGRLQRAVLELLEEHRAAGELPTNVRFLFYELEQRGVVTKDFGRGQRHDGQNLSDALTRLREAGLVPWEWIIDETRTLHEWECAGSVAEYLAQELERARIDPWEDEAPLLLVESKSLAGVLTQLAYTYLVPLAATGGQVGGFLHTEIVPLLEAGDRHVLYLGDLDHQGGQIEANTRRVLERGGELDWTRVAITRQQVDERGIKPIVKRDRRYRAQLEHEAWETEALGQGTVVGLVRAALDELLPEPLANVRVREREQRAAWKARLEA